MKTYCAVFSLMIFFFHCGEHQQIPEQPQEKAIETFDCGKLPGKEKSIRYQIARRTRTNDGVLLLNISTDKKNLEHDNLIALACRLRSDTATESRVFVQIFDSRRSAERYVPQWQNEKPPDSQKNTSSWRATYLRDSVKHEHWVAWCSGPPHQQEIFVALEYKH